MRMTACSINEISRSLNCWILVAIRCPRYTKIVHISTKGKFLSYSRISWLFLDKALTFLRNPTLAAHGDVKPWMKLNNCWNIWELVGIKKPFSISQEKGLKSRPFEWPHACLFSMLTSLDESWRLLHRILDAHFCQERKKLQWRRQRWQMIVRVHISNVFKLFSALPGFPWVS